MVFQSTASDDQLARIASEAAISSSLVHRNIVSTYAHDVRTLTSDTGAELGVFKFHLIQEYCSGGSLREAIDSGALRRLPARWNAIAALLLDVVGGMEYMHANRICHSDLNPANILLQARTRTLSCAIARVYFRRGGRLLVLQGCRIATRSQDRHIDIDTSGLHWSATNAANLCVARSHCTQHRRLVHTAHHPPRCAQVAAEDGAASPRRRGTDLLAGLAAGGVTAKISDFGLSKRMHSKQAYVANVRQGTPLFMAPELAQKHQLHPQSDVYSFGVMMWEIMMGLPVALEL